MSYPAFTSKPDLIPIWRTGWRKMVAFRTVSQKKQDGPVTAESLIARIAAIQKKAASDPQVSAKTAALWKMESLGVTFARLTTHSLKLDDASLPAEARPIAHVGLGAGAVEAAKFDPVKISRLIDTLSHPDYRLFAYESLGAMLGVYEKDAPRKMLGLQPLSRPQDAAFIAAFPPEVQRLISHGFGRLLYFQSPSIKSAFANINQRSFLEVAPAVQGMAFGYTMVNHNELGQVLRTGESFSDPKLAQAFQSGLIYALMFWEWMSPGFLQSLRAPHAQGEKLMRTARQEIETARQRGCLPPFAVERPN